MAAIFVVKVITHEPAQSALTSTTPSQTPKALIGFSLSPLSYSATDFTNFFVKATQLGNTVSWQGDWHDLTKTSSTAITLISLSKTYHFTPVLVVSAPATADQVVYKTAVVNFVNSYKPPYLGLGNEINTTANQKIINTNAFSRLFADIRSAVPASTKLFTTFQLEQLKGLNGGLYGGSNNTANNLWSWLDKFPTADLIAFTTYPGVIYKNVADIPANYYQEIAQHTAKPVAFTEAGWSSDNTAPGWNSTQGAQSQFINYFFTEAKLLKPNIVIWTFLYDQNVDEPFTQMGLIDKTGDKTSLQTWKTSQP